MTLDLSGSQEILLVSAFTLPRMMAALTISPFFGPQFIQGIARQVVVISLSLVALPVVEASDPVIPQGPLMGLHLTGVLAKEVAIGLLLGFAGGVVFWIAEGTGFFIDNQRGSSMAEMFDPMSDGSSSPFGILLTRIVGVLFFVGGGFTAFLSILYSSYEIWPVFSYFPSFRPGFPEACLGLLDGVMGLIVTFAAPIVIAMFLAEFGLGLVNRFSPQLNVFFLAMPVKSGIASVIIILYLVFLVGFFERQFATPDSIRTFYNRLFE